MPSFITWNWRDLKTDERQRHVARDAFPFLGRHYHLGTRLQEHLRRLPEVDEVWHHAQSEN